MTSKLTAIISIIRCWVFMVAVVSRVSLCVIYSFSQKRRHKMRSSSYQVLFIDSGSTPPPPSPLPLYNKEVQIMFNTIFSKTPSLALGQKLNIITKKYKFNHHIWWTSAPPPRPALKQGGVSLMTTIRQT